MGCSPERDVSGLLSCTFMWMRNTEAKGLPYLGIPTSLRGLHVRVLLIHGCPNSNARGINDGSHCCTWTHGHCRGAPCIAGSMQRALKTWHDVAPNASARLSMEANVGHSTLPGCQVRPGTVTAVASTYARACQALTEGAANGLGSRQSNREDDVALESK